MMSSLLERQISEPFHDAKERLCRLYTGIKKGSRTGILTVLIIKPGIEVGNTRNTGEDSTIEDHVIDADGIETFLTSMF